MAIAIRKNVVAQISNLSAPGERTECYSVLQVAISRKNVVAQISNLSMPEKRTECYSVLQVAISRKNVVAQISNLSVQWWFESPGPSNRLVSPFSPQRCRSE